MDRKIIKKIIIQTGQTKKNTGEGLGEISRRCLTEASEGHLGRQTLAGYFLQRWGGDYDAKMEEMCCYSLCLFTNSKQGFKVAYYYRKQALKYDT